MDVIMKTIKVIDEDTLEMKEITIEELANIFLQQQEKGVHNINLVTPTMYAYQIREAIKIAKEKRTCYSYFI